MHRIPLPVKWAAVSRVVLEPFKASKVGLSVHLAMQGPSLKSWGLWNVATAPLANTLPSLVPIARLCVSFVALACIRKLQAPRPAEAALQAPTLQKLRIARNHAAFALRVPTPCLAAPSAASFVRQGCTRRCQARLFAAAALQAPTPLQKLQIAHNCAAVAI